MLDLAYSFASMRSEKGVHMTHDSAELVSPAPIPLPVDYLNRYWLELLGVNPSLVNQFRSTLVTFLAFDKDRSVSPQTTVGTGFICGSSPEQGIALVITAIDQARRSMNLFAFFASNVVWTKKTRDTKPWCSCTNGASRWCACTSEAPRS